LRQFNELKTYGVLWRYQSVEIYNTGQHKSSQQSLTDPIIGKETRYLYQLHRSFSKS